MFEIFDTHSWLLPAVIFFGRICDVTLGTLRIIFVSKGERYKAPIVGFFEVFIWVVIISQIFSHANSLLHYVSYAAGYATGNYAGILVENRIALGYILFRVYAKNYGHDLAKELHSNGFGSTYMRGEGSVSQIDIVETVVSRKSCRKVVEIIEKFDSKAFYLVEDIRAKQKGIFTMTSAGGLLRPGK